MSGFANIQGLAKGFADQVKAKTQDALANAQQVQQRVTQQAMEAAGIADKTGEDDDVPELKYA